MNRKEIFQRAWEIAREGQKQFGGSVKDYFSASLKLAYASKEENQFKKMINNSEKAIKRINKIINKEKQATKEYIEATVAIVFNAQGNDWYFKSEELFSSIKKEIELMIK